MENPFELILEKLNSIEKMIGQLHLGNGSTSASADVTDINEASQFLGLSKSALYKMTSNVRSLIIREGKDYISVNRNWLNGLCGIKS